MTWSDTDWADAGYFEDVRSALLTDSFEDVSDGRPLVMQMGVNITERVDLLLKDPDSFDEATLLSALAALTTLAEQYPTEFLEHIRRSIGVLDFAGLLDTTQPLVARFWATFFSSVPPASGSWSETLRDALTDKCLAAKVRDYCTVCNRGGTHADALAEVDAEFPRIGWLWSKAASYHVARIISAE